MGKKLTDKDIEKVIKKIEDTPTLDRITLHPKASARWAYVIESLEHMGGEATLVFGNTEYLIALKRKHKIIEK